MHIIKTETKLWFDVEFLNLATRVRSGIEESSLWFDVEFYIGMEIMIASRVMCPLCVAMAVASKKGYSSLSI